MNIMKVKKLIIFYPSFERGGVEIILVNLIKYFLKKKIQVVLITSSIKEKKILRNKLFKIRNIKTTPKSFLSDRIKKAFSASGILINEIKKTDKKNTIVFSLQGSSLAIVISRLLGIKILVRNAENAISSTIHADQKIQALVILFFKIFTYNFASGIITNSIGSGISLKKLLFIKKKIYPIYNPYINKIRTNKITKKKNLILSIGRLTKQKDFKNLIISFSYVEKYFSNYKLVIIGDGELKDNLKTLVENLKLQNKVIFTGWKNNMDIYYKSSKLFVLNSIYEGLGNVVIDAVNYNLPIITTNCKSGPSEIIDNGKGGYIVPIQNPKKLSSQIIYCLKNYKLSIKKSHYAKKRISRFLCETNSKKYLNLINYTLNV
jgi:glycosyltransferase involved in cell wall biosynthesis